MLIHIVPKTLTQKLNLNSFRYVRYFRARSFQLLNLNSLRDFNMLDIFEPGPSTAHSLTVLGM